MSALPPSIHDGYRPCVGLMVVAPGRGIFVGRRIGIVGGWQMPQGGIDPGESPETAAFRELKEETGLSEASIIMTHPDWLEYDLPDWALRRGGRARWIGQTQKWFLLQYDGPDASVNLSQHQVEFDEWRWARPQEVLDEIVDFKRRVYEKVMAKFAAPAEAIMSGESS
jgi:putative (di)nucleoside polyphosphate hydrolase